MSLYNNEQQFKMSYIKQYLENSKVSHVFCVETEETVHGFPDVLVIGKNRAFVRLYEFKYSNKSGVIKFQPTQPAFYKKYSDLNVIVVAYNSKTDQIHEFRASELFTDGDYKINEKAEVNLCRREKRIKG